MNVLPSSVSVSRSVLPLRSLSATAILSILSACTGVSPKQNPTPSQYSGATAKQQAEKINPLEVLKGIQELLEQKMGDDPLFGTIDNIENFICDYLSRNGHTAEVRVTIAPFIPAGEDQWIYLIMSIKIGNAYYSLSLTSKNETQIAERLTVMVDSFQKDLQVSVFYKFQDVLMHKTDDATWADITKDVANFLSGESRKFIQHGYEYRGCTIEKNPETGEIEIQIDIYDIKNEKNLKLPIRTFLHQKERKEERDRREDGISMLA